MASKNFCDHSSDEEDKQLTFAQIVDGPINKKFYLALIELEHQISNKLFFSMQQVLDLVGMYGRCVEYFDSSCDPVRWYFLEKISNTLAESQTHEMILANEKKVKEEQRQSKEIKPIIHEANVKQNPLMRPKTAKPVNSGSQKKEIIQTTAKETSNFDLTQICIKQKVDEETGNDTLTPSVIKKIIDLEKDTEKKVSLRQNREIRTKKLNMIEEVIKEKQYLSTEGIVDQWGKNIHEAEKKFKEELNTQTENINDRLQRRKRNQSSKRNLDDKNAKLNKTAETIDNLNMEF